MQCLGNLEVGAVLIDTFWMASSVLACRCVMQRGWSFLKEEWERTGKDISGNGQVTLQG